MPTEAANTDMILYLAIGEFIFLFIIIITVVMVLLLSKKKKNDSKATVNLANKLNNRKVERKQELSGILSEIYHIDDEKLAEEAARLMKVENRFYQRFIKTYLTRDSEAVEKIDEEIQELFSNYNKLVPQEVQDERADMAIADIEQINDPEHESQIARLKETINNISDDLKQYKATLNRLFYEYTAMFGVDVDPRNQLSAKEIMTRLESGKLGDYESFDDSQEDDEVISPDEDVIESIINDAPDNPLEVLPEPLPEPETENSSIGDNHLAANSKEKTVTTPAPAAAMSDDDIESILNSESLDDVPATSEESISAEVQPESSDEEPDDEFEKEFQELLRSESEK